MRSNRRPKACLILAALAALFLAGCRDTPSVAGLRWEIERQMPGIHLERESHLRLGRFTFGVLKRVALWAMDDDEEEREIVTNIRRVELATYRVRGLPAGGELEAPRFERRLAAAGWETVVRVREDDERTWVFYRADDSGAIRNLYVVALDRDELAVIDLEGRLDRVFAAALADDPDGFVEILGA